MTREKLEQVYYLSKELEMWKQRRRELCTGIPQGAFVMDGMPHSRTNTVKKPVEDAALRISDSIEKIDKMIALHIQKIARAKLEVEEFILSIDDTELRLIIEYRCVYLLTWRKIGEKMGYDFSVCRKKYIKYLKKMAER